MKSIKNRYYILSVALLGMLSLVGCKDFFNPDSPDTLNEKDYMKSYPELYSGYMGIGASVQQVADKAIYLEGLRSDFLEPTPSATKDFWDVYKYQDVVSGTPFNDNKLADPSGYYKVILNANDFIKHAYTFRQDNPNAIDQYQMQGLISGAIRYKVWAYLMLAKIYGEAIYIDDPMVGYQDITKYPKWKFDQIINKCYDLMLSGMSMYPGYNGMSEFDWASFLTPPTGSAQDMATRDMSANRLCPPPYALMAELNLWIGNYQGVVENFKQMINAGYNQYDGDYSQLDFMIDTRGRNNSSGSGNYTKMFTAYRSFEHVAIAKYDYTQQQTNNLLKYFSAHQPNQWYLTPSKVAMDRYATQKDVLGTTYNDYRGTTSSSGLFNIYNNKLEFRKFTSDNESGTATATTVPVVILYRATDLYMFLVEALVQLGQFDAALLFLNGEGSIITPSRFAVENVYNPGGILYGFPTLLRGVRYSNASGYCCIGIRGRIAQSRVDNKGVGLRVLPSQIPFPGATAITNSLSDPAYLSNVTKSQKYLDSLVVEETIMEFPGESRALYSMIRMSKRWGDDARKVWASKVAAKYNGGTGDEAIKAKLSENLDNWFIKYDLDR